MGGESRSRSSAPIHPHNLRHRRIAFSWVVTASPLHTLLFATEPFRGIARTDLDPPADGILGRPEASRHRFIDDDNVFMLAVVKDSEVAATNDGDSHGMKVAGQCQAETGGPELAGNGGDTLDGEIAVGIAAGDGQGADQMVASATPGSALIASRNRASVWATAVTVL